MMEAHHCNGVCLLIVISFNCKVNLLFNEQSWEIHLWIILMHLFVQGRSDFKEPDLAGPLAAHYRSSLTKGTSFQTVLRISQRGGISVENCKDKIHSNADSNGSADMLSLSGTNENQSDSNFHHEMSSLPTRRTNRAPPPQTAIMQ